MLSQVGEKKVLELGLCGVVVVGGGVAKSQVTIRHNYDFLTGFWGRVGGGVVAIYKKTYHNVKNKDGGGGAEK